MRRVPAHDPRAGRPSSPRSRERACPEASRIPLASCAPLATTIVTNAVVKARRRLSPLRHQLRTVRQILGEHRASRAVCWLIQPTATT